MLSKGGEENVFGLSDNANLNTVKNNKLKNCFVGIFHFTFEFEFYCCLGYFNNKIVQGLSTVLQVNLAA